LVPSSPTRPLPVRLGLLYAAGDIGPSLTSLCLAFYWLYFLIDVAGLGAMEAGLIHGSGYVVSAGANLWAGSFLDRRIPSLARRARLIAVLGLALAGSFVLLWTVPPLGAFTAWWYLALSWLFHLVFALVYLAYLSLTPLLATDARARVDLNSFRFGGTMLVSLAVLCLQGALGVRIHASQRLLALGAMVGLLAAAGSVVCGTGLARTLGTARVVLPEQPVRWAQLAGSPVVWRALGANLVVWFMVQSASVLTIFLCRSAVVADGPILLLMQGCIIVAAVLTSVASRRWPPATLLGAASGVWCAGAACWWHGAAPMAAAMLLGLGLGTATVISWAQVPEALDRYAATAGQPGDRADARAYATLTVLRDLVSAAVPVLVTVGLDGRMVGSAASGHAAAVLLAGAALCTALGIAAITRLPGAVRRPAGDGTTGAPR
jgi:GPH family glycoside/pentoside/hexuronide:cation symporter